MNLREIVNTDKLEHAVDLYYVCLLGKYLKARNVKLSLSGIDISSFSEVIDNSVYYDYFRYAVENGYISDLAIDLPVFEGEESDLEKYLFMQSFDEVKPFFYKQLDNKYYIDMHDVGGSYTNVRLFRESIEESAIIDLTSYFHVCSLFNNETYELHPKFSNTLRDAPLGVSSLFYIANSPLCKSILKFQTYGNRDLNSLKYNTWYFLGLEKGLLKDDGFSTTEKFEKLQGKEYQVGNVVFLYERLSTAKSRKTYKLRRSLIAIVREVNEKTIILEKVPTKHTRLERIKKHEDYSAGVQELYRHDDFEVVTLRESFSLTSMGVGYLMSDSLSDFEEFFITSIPNEGQFEMWVEQEGFEFQCLLTTKDAVFWVLKDWGIDFDEKLYIETYYKDGQIPLYYDQLVDDFGYAY